MSTNPYDQVPYPSEPFQQTHPDRLATMATLFGLDPPQLDCCRVLELGCASGGNLIPLAEQLPDSEFVGIDASIRQIELGQQMVASLELTNISLVCGDILIKDEPLEPFDYIVAHGLFSWVTREVQDRIFEICARCLSGHGIAFISYNTLPGWHLRGIVRDLMMYQARSTDEPAERIRKAREIVASLAAALPEEDCVSPLLKEELELIRDRPDSYIFHEYLEPINSPLYFRQFVERAEASGLQYLCDSDYSSMVDHNFSPAAQELLRSCGDDHIEAGQMMDFIRKQPFRQTLLCRSGVPIDRSSLHHRIRGLRVASPATWDEELDLNPKSSQPSVFKRGDWQIETINPLLKAALVHLRGAWPYSVPCLELLAAVRRRFRTAPLVQTAHEEEEVVAGFFLQLLRCYSWSIVDLSLRDDPFALEPAGIPQANALARLQSQTSTRLTNLASEMIEIDDFERRLIGLLDGRSRRGEVINGLCSLVQRNLLSVESDGERIRGQDAVRAVIDACYDGSLEKIAKYRFLRQS